MNPDPGREFEQGPEPAFDAALEAYLDGAMSPGEARAFEARLAEDGALRGLVERSRAADESLRRLFAPPAEEEAPPIAGRIGARRWVLVAAAAAAVALVGLVVVLSSPKRREPPTPATVYAKLVEEGYTPQWRCDNDEEFELAVVRRLGQPLLIAEAPRLEVLGWAYGDRYSGGTISEQTMVLMTVYNGEKVLAMIDRAYLDREVELPKGSKVRIFRRTIENLVVWEVTPLDRPVTLEHFYVPR